jgi:hypothetical protein
LLGRETNIERKLKLVILIASKKMRFPENNIFLRQEVTKQLVTEKYNGFDGLAAAWEEEAMTRPMFPKSKQRSTVYRWLIDGVPSSKDKSECNIFALSSLLDVDPLVLFDFKRNGFFSNFAKLRQLIYFGNNTIGGLAPLLRMFKPGDEWPSDFLARNFYDRPWFSEQFSNEGELPSSDYVLLKARFSENLSAQPLAVHIAYRRTNSPDTMWRYYGSVLSIQDKLELYSEGGSFQKMDIKKMGEIQFRTYFGGRPVEWRVVSLHNFSLDRDMAFNDMQIIGFNW